MHQSPDTRLLLRSLVFVTYLCVCVCAVRGHSFLRSHRSDLATPVGLLFNELANSPEVVVRSLRQLLTSSLDLDTGTFASDNAAIILYIVRLTVRVDGYLKFLLTHTRWRQRMAQRVSLSRRNVPIAGGGVVATMQVLVCVCVDL